MNNEIDGKDLLADLQSSEYITKNIHNDAFAKVIYRAICHVSWVKNGYNVICTAMQASIITATLKGDPGQYGTYYMSGKESVVQQKLERELNQLGWVRDDYKGLAHANHADNDTGNTKSK